MRACPFCAEKIQDAAIFCKHCRRDLPSRRAPLAAGQLCEWCGAGKMERCRIRRHAPLYVIVGYALWAVALLLMAITTLAYLFAAEPQTSTPRNGLAPLYALAAAILVAAWSLTNAQSEGTSV